MIHRILRGQRATEMAVDLLKEKKILKAWDLSTGGFQQCARVLSPLAVLTGEQQMQFDDMLAEIGQSYGVIWLHDVGSFLGAEGTELFTN
jgi:hypothetical protein